MWGLKSAASLRRNYPDQVPRVASLYGSLSVETPLAVTAWYCKLKELQ